MSARAGSDVYNTATGRFTEAIENAIKDVRPQFERELPSDEELSACVRAALRVVRTKFGLTDIENASVVSGSTASSFSGIADGTKRKSRSAASKNKKPVRVYVDGCFDIMHSVRSRNHICRNYPRTHVCWHSLQGHYNVLRQAKQLGDILIAGVHSCAEIQRVKGARFLSTAASIIERSTSSVGHARV
jgi:bifunctional ADP-heptose synthase (sugar kinase/adenylyltransferase)